MKYIMFKIKLGKDLEKKVPIIFPNELVHSQVARGLMPHLREISDEVKIASAGDIIWPIGCNIQTGGRSETLKTIANPDDGEDIAMYDYFHGL